MLGNGAKILVVLITIVIIILGIFTQNYSIAIMIWCMLSVFAILKAAKIKNQPLRYIGIIASVYYGIAYPLKAAVSQLPSSDLTLDYLVPKALFFESSIYAILYGCGVVLSFIVISQMWPSWPKGQAKGSYPVRINEKQFFLFVLASLCLKFVAHYVLKWGVPGAQPHSPIPIVTGLVVLYCRLGLSLLTGVCLALICIGKLKRVEMLQAGVLSLAYILLDLGVGSKYSLVYSCVSLFFFYFLERKSKGLSLLKSKKTLYVAIVGAVAISSYGVVNYYRFARLNNENGSTAELLTKAKDDYAQKNETDQLPLIREGLLILARVNGFQNLAGAISFKDVVDCSLYDLLDSSSATARYTTATTGVDNENNAYGFTQAGMVGIIVSSNFVLVIMLSALQSLVVLLAFYLVFYYLKVNVALTWALTINLALFYVGTQMAGGNFLFLGKQLLMIALASYVVSSKFISIRIG